MSAGWEVGAITGKFESKGEPNDQIIAGWIKGPFGLDFRVFWDDDLDGYPAPGWVLTHLDSGRIVRCMLGSLAAAQAYADRLADAADWNVTDPAAPQYELGKIVKATMAEFPNVRFTTESRLGPLA